MGVKTEYAKDAASGALKGAAIGSAVPVIGTTLGAIGGGLLGLFTSDAQDKYGDGAGSQGQGGLSPISSPPMSPEQLATNRFLLDSMRGKNTYAEANLKRGLGYGADAFAGSAASMRNVTPQQAAAIASANQLKAQALAQDKYNQFLMRNQMVGAQTLQTGALTRDEQALRAMIENERIKKGYAEIAQKEKAAGIGALAQGGGALLNFAGSETGQDLIGGLLDTGGGDGGIEAIADTGLAVA